MLGRTRGLSRTLRVISVTMFVITSSVVLKAADQSFFLRAESESERREAFALVEGLGGRLVATYPKALLVELPQSIAHVAGGQLVPLPDLHLIGHWKGSFDPLDVTPEISAVLGAGATGAGIGRSLRLIQFVGPPQDSWLEEVRSLGVELVTYFPHASYMARFDDAQMGSVRRLQFVRAIVPWHAALKFDPEIDRLRNKDLPAVEINLVVFNPRRDPEDTGNEKNAIREQGRIVSSGLMGNHEVIRATVPSAQLNSLAALPNVIAVEAYHPPEPDDEASILVTGGHISGETGFSPPNPTHRGNGVAGDWLTTIGANGSNVTVGIVDDGVTTSEVHVSGRVVDILSGAAAGGDGHGHHVASIVAGTCTHADDSQGYKLGAGAAPFASILNQPFLKTGWTNTCGTATQYGCLTKQTVTTNGTNGIPGYVQNNSWGSGAGLNPQTYGSAEREYDLRVRDANESTAAREELVVCFSAGNSGSAGMTKPKSAKNIITTGAIDNYRPGFSSSGSPGPGNGCPSGGQSFAASNINMMVCFSSFGYVDDGRVKPDVVSPGADVAGARTNSYVAWGAIDADHVWVSGTSQASPNTAGQAALIVSKWKLNNAGASPSPAMVKAILINSADDIRTTTAATSNTVQALHPSSYAFPNNREGWGRVNTKRHLNPGTVPIQYVDQTVGNTFGDSLDMRTFNYTVGSSTDPLYITLVWSDAAAAINANPQLVNDLDLEVVWNGNTYLGNVMRGATGASGKVSITGGSRDSRNNVENVFLPAVSAGQTISIRVRATAINGDAIPGNADITDQDFALVVYNGAGCTAPSVPTGVTAVANGANTVRVSWTAPGGSPAPTTYRIYRSVPGAACPTTGYTLIGTVAAPAVFYDDTTTSGGSTYSYRVTAVGGSCESVQSACSSAAATGSCTLPPTFAGLSTATSGSTSTCTLNLSWPAATSNCAGAITYNVYRSTSAGFTPAPGNRIATGVVLTNYSDLAVTAGTKYYYQVRAVDSSNGLEDTNTVAKSVAPQNTTVLYTQNFDSLGAGNMAAFTTSGTGATDWRGVMACSPNQSAGNIFRFGGTTCTSSYLNDANAQAVINGATGVAIPVGAASTRLNFWHRWNFEAGYDGGYVRIQRAGDAGYINVPSSAILTGPYNDSAGSVSVWSGDSNSSMTNSIADLDAACNAIAGNTGGCAGKTIFIAFAVITDSSVTRPGWFIDNVQVTYDTPCTGCTPPGTPTGLALSTPANNTIRLTWSSPAGATYNVYRESGVCPATAPALVASGITGTTYDDVGVAGGTAYRYVVRAVGATNCESAASACQSVTSTGPALAVPLNLVATAEGTSRVHLSWRSILDAIHYVVERTVDNVTFVGIATPEVPSFIDSAVEANKSYLYRIVARDGSGNASSPSNHEVATTIVFTDEPLIGGMLIKAVHLTQLRTAVNAMRTLASIGLPSYTDPTVNSGAVTAKRLHIIELRTNLDAARAALSLTGLSYTDATIDAGVTGVKAVHFQELRNGTK